MNNWERMKAGRLYNADSKDLEKYHSFGMETCDKFNRTPASIDELKAAKCFALGCPAMGAEVLEEGEMEPFVSEVEGFAAGKTIALFGSYGWGDGQWMRDWTDRMNGCGATVLNGEGLICNETPDDAALAECEALGKALASV